jgi:hypothetical protein
MQYGSLFLVFEWCLCMLELPDDDNQQSVVSQSEYHTLCIRRTAVELSVRCAPTYTSASSHSAASTTVTGDHSSSSHLGTCTGLRAVRTVVSVVRAFAGSSCPPLVLMLVLVLLRTLGMGLLHVACGAKLARDGVMWVLQRACKHTGGLRWSEMELGGVRWSEMGTYCGVRWGKVE